MCVAGDLHACALQIFFEHIHSVIGGVGNVQIIRSPFLVLPDGAGNSDFIMRLLIDSIDPQFRLFIFTNGLGHIGHANVRSFRFHHYDRFVTRVFPWIDKCSDGIKVEGQSA